MKLLEARFKSEKTQQSFAFNEITGQLVAFLKHTPEHLTLLEGDSKKPGVLCELLFNSDDIEECWNLLDNETGREFFEKNR